MGEVIVLFCWTTYLLLWLWVLRYAGKKQRRGQHAMRVPMPGLEEPVLSYGQFLDRYCDITGMLPGFDVTAYLYQRYLEYHEPMTALEGEP